MKKNPEYRTEKDLLNLAPLIKEIQFFKQRNIEGNHLNDICLELRHEFLPAGEFVFRQGDYGDRFYVILSGQVQVLINNPKNKDKRKQAKKHKKEINPVYVTRQTLRKQVNHSQVRHNNESHASEEGSRK